MCRAVSTDYAGQSASVAMGYSPTNAETRVAQTVPFLKHFKTFLQFSNLWRTIGKFLK